jgi:hypothetical protein
MAECCGLEASIHSEGYGEKLESQAEEESGVLSGLTTVAQGTKKGLPGSCAYNSTGALSCEHCIIMNNISSCLSNQLPVKQNFMQLKEQPMQSETSVAVLLKVATFLLTTFFQMNQKFSTCLFQLSFITMKLTEN